MGARQSDSATTRISATAISGIGTILESARTGTSLSATVSVPEIEIGFFCEFIRPYNYIYSSYGIGGLTRQIPSLPTFVPGNLEGRDIVTWTYSWDMPFKIMNFLFLANSKTRFFFFFPTSDLDPLKTLINESFSNNIKHNFVKETDEILDYNEDNTIIVIFSRNGDFVGSSEFYIDLTERFSGDVTIVKIIPSDSNYLFGNIKYYDKSKTQINNFRDPLQEKTSYFGLASLFGAIFSPDGEYYECSMTKALARLNRVACVYKQKYVRLRDAYSHDTNCLNVYTQATSIMDSYFTEQFCIHSGDRIELGSLNEKDFSSYTNELFFHTSLANANRQAILNSCELLY